MDITVLKDTLGMAMSTISSEHFFSAGLSSPWSVAKFAESQEDYDEVWNYFDESAKSSLIFGGILSYSLKSWWPIVGSAVTVWYYKGLYNKALNKASTNGLNKLIQQQGLKNSINQITKNGSIEEIRSLTDFLSNQKYPVGGPKTTGTVCFGSDPPGANIYVDGMILIDPKTEETKRTPTCAPLIEGRRDIVFSLPPHADVSRYVDVMPGKSISIYARFK